jgi:MFS family permease
MADALSGEKNMMNRWWRVAGIIGPIIAGRLFDIFGNYTNAFYVGSGICVLALGSLWMAKRPEAPAVVAIGEVKGARAA